MEYNIIYLSGGRQKSYLVIWRPPEEINYLAAARRDKLSGGRQKSYLAAARRVIWRPPDNSSGGRQIIICGRQKSYEGQSKLLSVFKFLQNHKT